MLNVKRSKFVNKMICLVLSAVMVMSMCVSASATVIDGHDMSGYTSFRTVFTDDYAEGIEGVTYLIDSNNVLYIPLAYTVFLSPENTHYAYNVSYNTAGAATSWTIETADRYSWANGYFTVWRNSKKLRISGHDETLKYSPVFLGELGTSGIELVYISVDDFERIYGFDKNIWQAKNTIYFSRNGQGLLQKYKAGAA